MRRSAPSAAGDAIALQRCWHPVTLSTATTAGPSPTQLLGSRIVLWRDSAGMVGALAAAWRERVGIEPTEVHADPSWF